MTEETLFERAAQLAAGERAAFLDRECAGRPELRARVEALLAADAASHSPLDRPVVVPDRTGEYTPSPGGPPPASRGATGPHPDSPAGTVIAGKYTLVEMIGEGGMGSVWRAKQTEPVKRFVAVKLIKAGMDSKQVVARFEAERQALALMDHPHIAKVLDGGLHEHRPFFVMELVKGTPITEYCDSQRLTPPQRLELFVQACQAIQHAHQKGIIHRDIKPSNVLVALYDDRPVVKVIDFGVAKATGGTLTEATIDTGFGGVVGTPQYMSPEQATFNNVDIDTRSDVYALGVLLYELLTGSPPFSGEELKKKGLLEILRVVREEEPPRPSTRLSTADALPSLSASRGTEPKKLTGLLRNELDWIVMKALEKDRSRRYETANGFAADVQRYLAGEPVQAHPPSRRYRLKKFVKRNKGQVIAASMVLLTLIGGTAGTTVGLIEANRQKREADYQAGLAKDEAAQKEQARAAEAVRAEAEKLAKELAEARRKEAVTNLTYATKGNDILGSVFKGLDPVAEYATVAELRDALKANLNKAVKELDGSAIGDPLVVAKLQYTLGQSFLGMGEPKPAILLLEKAFAVRKARLGPTHDDTLATMSNLALGYRSLGDLDRSVSLSEEVFKIRTALLGPDHPHTTICMHAVASCYMDQGHLRKALPLLEKSLKRQKARLGPDHPDNLATIHSLAVCYFELGLIDKAMPLYEEAFKLSKALHGPNHPFTLKCRRSLGVGLMTSRRLDEAIPLFEEVIKLQKGRLGHQHADTLQTTFYLANAYWQAGKSGLAVSLLEENVKHLKATLGPDHPQTIGSMNNLAEFYRLSQKLEKAVPLYEETLKSVRAKLGSDHPTTITIMGNLGAAYCNVKQGEKAALLLKEFAAGMRKRYPKDAPQFAGLLAQMSQELVKLSEFATVEAFLRECLAIREKTQPNVWTTFNTQSMLGAALLGQKKYAAAEPLLLKGYEGMKAREKAIPPQGAIRVPEALDRLIELYTATNKPDEVKKYKALRQKYPAAKTVEATPAEKK